MRLRSGIDARALPALPVLPVLPILPVASREREGGERQSVGLAALGSVMGLAEPRRGQTCWSFQRHKTATEGKEQSVLPARGRQDIKWAEVIAEENQVKHHKKQSEQGGQHRSAGVEAPGPGAGAGRDGRAAPSPPRPPAIYLRSRGHLWALVWALGSAPLPTWARLPVPPPSPLICPHFSPVTPSPCPGAGTGSLPCPGSCWRSQEDPVAHGRWWGIAMRGLGKRRGPTAREVVADPRW